MSRLNTKSEVIADVTEVGIMTDVSGGWSTTLDGAVSEGATALTVADGSSVQDSDKFRLGDRPYIEAGIVESGGATANLTLQSVVSDDYDSGEAVVEVEDTPIGDLTEDGIEVQYDGGDTAIRSGTHKGVWQYIPSGDRAISVAYAMLNLSMENLAESVGMDPSTRIAGAGTTADPYIIDIREDRFAEQPLRIWYFLGARLDGAVVRVEAFAGKVFAPGGSVSYAQGQASELPFLIRVLHGVRHQQWS